MPKSIGGLVGFAVMAVITVLVGNFVYSRLVQPLVSKVMQKAA